MNKNNKILWFSGLTAFIFGLIAFFPPNAPIVPSFIQTFYDTFTFMMGDGGHDLVHASISEQIAAVAVPIFVGSAIVSIFYKYFKNFIFLNQANHHTVICGLGNMGFTLAKDILKNHKEINLFILENNPKNPHIGEIESMGAVVIVGDALNSHFLKKIKAHKASEVILLTGKDIVNIEIASEFAQLIKKYKSQTKIHIHLDNRDNYDLLSSDIFKNKKSNKQIDIKSFSIYDLAAQTLFMKHPLDGNVDTLDSDVVKVAIVGYAKAAEAILYRVLNLGHFYNQKPIEITIFDENIKDKKRIIQKSYPMLEDKENNIYWSIDYKDESELYLCDSLPYTKIIFCDNDIEKSFTDAMRLKRLRSSELVKSNTQVHLFGDVYKDLVKILKKDDKVAIDIFGLLCEICSYDVVVNEKFDAMAKETDRRYNELHGYDANWDNLSAFKKDSNRMQVEHLPIKLKIINHHLFKKIRHNDYDKLKEQAKTEWFKYETKIIWDNLKDAKILAQYISSDVLDRLSRVEHNRWNAFHILNGWKKKGIPANAQSKVTQDKALKLHPCLVSWDELDTVSKNHMHDYKSDDIETVMRISDMTEHLDEAKLDMCYMRSYIIKFRNLITEIKNLQV